MIVHIMAQPQLNEGEGPIGVIVAPTRELSEQTHKQARIFGKTYGRTPAMGCVKCAKLDYDIS